MIAAGTKLLIVRAKKVTDRNGIVIPDQAQPNSCYGLILSLGPDCSEAMHNEMGLGDTVILFNPNQTMGSEFSDIAGRLTIEAIDQEAVLATMSVEEAKEWFGCEFPEVPEDCPV